MRLTETQDGKKCLVVETVDQDGPIRHDIPLAAVSSWRELLGIDDPVEVVQAILHVLENGEPDPDPVTGRNPWTESYALLSMREQARSVEAAKAEADRADQPTIIERANKAAYDAVHIPVKGDKCAMDLCREQTQRELGMPNVDAKCGPDTRVSHPVVKKPVRAMWERIGPLPERRSRAEEIAECLEGHEAELLECTQRFLHKLSGDITDRITPPAKETEPEPAPRILAPDEVLAKYQEAEA